MVLIYNIKQYKYNTASSLRQVHIFWATRQHHLSARYTLSGLSDSLIAEPGAGLSKVFIIIIKKCQQRKAGRE